ncbi:IMPACT family protein [Undibacterium sp.]|uniref:IMPACT family protein n=1 Tax=Undibacterium sp. TaxID=1914977 RepID=UPI00374CEAD2
MYQLAGSASAEIEVKKSRFLGSLHPVSTRAEARALLAVIRAQHPNAVHVCWVLLCEGDSGLDDDGEPSGTAAKPMYNVLVHKEVANVLAVVVRYWGGIKLGAGGLTRAYGQAISDAFKAAQLVPVEVLCERHFGLHFADESAFRRLAEQYAATVIDAAYGDNVRLQLRLKLKDAEEFELAAVNLLRGSLQRLDSGQ